MPSGEQAARRVGQELAGRYRLDALLGCGGMGAVYRARQLFTEADVAVKLLGERHEGSSEAAERFVREARAVARIEHPNVVRVLDMGRDDDGTLYLVQELLAGEDLARHLAEQHRLSPRACRAILLPLLRGLVRVHERGVIHRDVKPANVILARTRDGETVPKLIDFGVARVADPSSPTATTTGQTLGTPAYMSPEQARGSLDVDARTDLWALGVMLFEMLAGKRPFEGPNSHAVLAEVLTREVPSLADVLPGVSPAIAAIVARALERRRERRFQTAAEFADAVESCEDFGSDATLAVAVARGSSGVTTVDASLPGGSGGVTPRGDEPAAPRARSRRTLVAAGVATLVTVSLAAFALRSPTHSLAPSSRVPLGSRAATTAVPTATPPPEPTLPAVTPERTPAAPTTATVAPPANPTSTPPETTPPRSTASAHATRAVDRRRTSPGAGAAPRATAVGVNNAPLLDPEEQD